MSDVHEQISSLALCDSSTSESPNVIEHPICVQTTSPTPIQEEKGTGVKGHTITDNRNGLEVEPATSGTCEAHNAQIRALQLRLADLENRLTQISENDARREAEIVLIKAENEARLQALEDRISEIHSRVLVMQEGLVRSGTIQRRQRA